MTLRARASLAGILLLFFLSAMLFVSRPGIEADEAVVSNPAIYSFHAVPLMMMSYYGALKAWFYLALFAVVKPGAVALRVPTVLLGTAAVWLFFLLLDGTVGRRAAWIGALLLATDSVFVILEAIDYGPNALHFVLKLGAMLMLLRFHRRGRTWALAAGFFLLGLGLWDKAIFAWVLFGLIVATLAVFPKEVWRQATIRNFAVAGLSIIAGALPLVMYNVAHPLETFRSNAHMARVTVAHKALLLDLTLNGSVLFGFFTSLEPPPHPGAANTPRLRVSQAAAGAMHHPVHNFTVEALFLACLGLFARASRKPVLFGLLAFAGTWLPMALTAGAGGAAHHVILLWPFQFFAIAAALAAIPWRFAAAAATVALCAASLAVTNEYDWELVHNGPALRWSDAMTPLEKTLETLRAPNIYIVDWDIVETVNFLSDDTAPAHGLDWSDTANLRKIVSDPRAVFVGHTARYAYFPQQRAILEEAASSADYEEVPVETIYDRYGRPTFDVFRFRKIPL